MCISTTDAPRKETLEERVERLEQVLSRIDTDAKIGEKAFSNPPMNLIPNEQRAVRQAIGLESEGQMVTGSDRGETMLVPNPS